MQPLPSISFQIHGRRLAGRLAFTILFVGVVLCGAAAGLLFVYSTDLPEIRALEDYRPNVVTEIYSDDGQQIGNFALQRRILLTWEQIPQVLIDAITSTEDQHFFEHWGVDLPRVMEAAWRNAIRGRIREGASTLTMQLAGGLFLDRSDRSFRRKIQETLLAIQIERNYTKQQIFTMYVNQVYLAHGNYGFEAASEFYFGRPVGKLTLPEAALLAALIRGPTYSPIMYPNRALERRNLVLDLMQRDGKITTRQEREARQQPIILNVQSPRNELAPYFVEEIRKYLESTYGTEAVHERGLRVYTTLNVAMQRAANSAVRDGLHAYDRRHGWRGNLPNVIRDQHASLQNYDNDDWHHSISKGDYVTGLIVAVDDTAAVIKIGPYRAVLTQPDFAWTGRRLPTQLLHVGDIAQFYIRDLSGSTAHVNLEQDPGPQSALVAIDNGSGEIKAMVGGYSFEDSKFNRATQAQRQVGSSFKVYVYAAALEKGFTPFDTILDAPFTVMSGGQAYSPHNYDERYEGMITLRRALAGSRNVPAVRLADKLGINDVIEVARRFGITSPLPPYLPITLGAADLNLMEHVSAFTVFPDDGIRIDAHLIRRVTTYDGALLEEARPPVHDVISPEVARTMVAMLEDVVNFGTGVGAKALGRPSGGKTGTTNDFTDAWYMGFTPQVTAGVWVGFDDKQKSLGNGETGARAALPIWLQFMQNALAGAPVENFPNVVPLEQVALTKTVHVDTPDSAPTEGSEEGKGHNAPQPPLPSQPAVAPQPAPPDNPPDPPSSGTQTPSNPSGQ
ncbi:MAG TPA: PBP1A family penicillin-binding protein [Candidatus Acidoferrales bacterium]|jgi:penicillin-binding protein 1A|nr:PBP1A family penicillin-binding protein [Candidatus Acidoferrales bacterium]